MEITQLLVQEGAEVNAVTENPMRVMPLHSAVAHNQNMIIEFLLNNGADVNVRQRGGYTPLHAAAQSGNLEAANLLLRHGANVNARKDDGKTPLASKEEGQEAESKKDRGRVSELLLQHGAAE